MSLTTNPPNTESTRVAAETATALEPWVVKKNVSIAPPDYAGEVLHLGPGAEVNLDKSEGPRILFVAGGAVTVRVGITHHMLTIDGAVAVPSEREGVLINHTEKTAKVFVATLPAPRVQWRLIPPDAFEKK
jgi:glyoxylate utilization-related uncharacterized protein